MAWWTNNRLGTNQHLPRGRFQGGHRSHWGDGYEGDTRGNGGGDGGVCGPRDSYSGEGLVDRDDN